MEAILQNGDYAPDGVGGFRRADGQEELLARVLYKLSVRRGSLPMCPELGSYLYRLGAEKDREQAARQYIAQALAGEDISVENVGVEPRSDGTLRVSARLTHDGHGTDISLTIGGSGI